MNTNNTYAGIPENLSSLENSKIVLIPVPYDQTTTWKKGTNKGPEAFLKASENMELYDIETNTEVYKKGVFLTPPLEVSESAEAMAHKVENEVKNYLTRKKFVTLIGGEHSISIGAIRAFNKHFENLTVLQLDAHADLRPTYEGTPYNHACALHEASQTTNLIQVGIRSMDVLENDYLNPENTFFAHEIARDGYWMDRALDNMTEDVYITLDLDVFDPSLVPATGTPEPGGLAWYETLEFLNMVFKEKNVVGFDIVELCPHPTLYASDFLAAKLYYKMLSYKFKYHTEDFEDNEIQIQNKSSKHQSKFKNEEE
jgi:agmatinase